MADRDRLRAEVERLKSSAGLPEELVERLRKADDALTDLQPKIANGLFDPSWVPVIDGYIDPALEAIRAVLAWHEQRTGGGE
jgi:hypothetical protein